LMRRLKETWGTDRGLGNISQNMAQGGRADLFHAVLNQVTHGNRPCGEHSRRTDESVRG